MTADDSRMRCVRGGGAEDDGGGGDGVVGAVVLADGEHVEPELVGELDLLHELAHALLRRDARMQVGEGGEAEFHAVSLAN